MISVAFMNFKRVFFRIAISREWFTTIFAFVIFMAFMNCVNVYLQTTYSRINIHFYNKLNLPFSELNVMPSVRPNLGIFKNFWYWISIFRQSSWVKKTQFELNLRSFKWASPRSALSGLPRLGLENPLKLQFCKTFHLIWKNYFLCWDFDLKSWILNSKQLLPFSFINL